MDIEQFLRDFKEAYEAVDITIKEIVDVGIPEMEKNLKFLHRVDGFYQDSMKRHPSPSLPAVQSLSEMLMGESLMTLLQIDYFNECEVTKSSLYHAMRTKDVAVLVLDGMFPPYLKYKVYEHIRESICQPPTLELTLPRYASGRERISDSPTLELPEPRYAYMRASTVYHSALELPEPRHAYMRASISHPPTLKVLVPRDIPIWIASKAHENIRDFVNNLDLIATRFPSERDVEGYIRNVVDEVDMRLIENMAFTAYLYHGEAIGTVHNRAYRCYWDPNVRAIKQDLVKETLDALAKDFGRKIAQEVSKHITNALLTIMRLNLSEIEKNISNETFLIRFTVLLRESIGSSFILLLRGVVDAIVAVFSAMKDTLVTVFLPVDINSKAWRREVAYEIFQKYEDNKGNIMEKLLSEGVPVVMKEATYLKTGILEFKQLVEKRNRAIKSKADSFSCEYYGEKDFEKADELRIFASMERSKNVKTEACIYDGYGGIEVPKGSEVLLRLSDGKQGEVLTYVSVMSYNIPMVSLDYNRENQEVIEIEQYKDKHIFQTSQTNDEEEQVYNIILEKTSSLLNRHSNLVAIDVCSVKSRLSGKSIEEKTCIVLYCNAKGFVPIGENLFPSQVDGYATDVREGYAVAFGDLKSIIIQSESAAASD